ncbi:MFS transporter [Candidatus Micrarchaeota archaeon]|nr:MFS transporter [Candidatus Micrarchaeota archaeon]
MDRKKGRKNVILLGITSFLNDLSSEMIMPILPFFLSSLGASPVLIGLVGGLRNSLDKLLTIFFGYFSDKVARRRPFVYGGYITSALFKLVLAFSPNAIFASSSASLERIGKGMRDAPRDAMIGKYMPERTGEGFGLHQMLDTGGAVCGAVAAVVLIAVFGTGYTTIILGAGIIAFASIIPLFFLEDNVKIKKKAVDFFGSLYQIPKELWAFNLIAGLFSLANFSYMFFLMKAQLSEGLVVPLMLYALFNVFYAAAAYPLGKKADEIGKRKILIGGYLLFSLVSLSFSVFSSLAALLLIFVFYGIAYAAVNLQRAYVVDIAPQRIKATAVGSFQLVVGLAAIPSGLIAGALWEIISPEATFVFGALLSMAAAILLFLKMPRSRND